MYRLAHPHFAFLSISSFPTQTGKANSFTAVQPEPQEFSVEYRPSQSM